MSKNSFYKFIATCGGAGYAPFAPGTFGAIVGCLLLILFEYTNLFTTDLGFYGLVIILTIFFYFLGVKATDELEKEWGKDPSKVVVDEMIGVWISMMFIPWSYFNLLLAFVLFRFFDILKPMGIRKLEAIPGGKGVMLDDVLAGVYANIILRVLLYFLEPTSGITI